MISCCFLVNMSLFEQPLTNILSVSGGDISIISLRDSLPKMARIVNRSSK